MQPTSGFFGRMKARMDRVSLRGSKGNRGSVSSLPTGASVAVNVYDMLWLNVYINNLGIGVYHTGVVVYGIEYCYGGHPLSYSGIFAMAPQDVETLGPNYSYKSTIEVGHTDFTEADIALILEDMGPQYRGDQYHLLRRNCNHFSDAFIQILCGASLPKWINRLASVGAKLPFIERTIPRVWLTPRSLEELNISDSDFPNGSSLGTGRRVLRKRRITSAGVARVHSHSTRHRPQDQSASAVFQLTTSADTHSVAGSSVRTASAAPKEVTTLSDHCISKPSLVSATGRVSRFRTRSSSAVSHQNVPTRCSKSTRDSSEINSVTPKEALSSRLRLPVTTLLAPRRPSSVYIVPSPQNSPQSSACSLVSPNGTLHLVDQLEITSSGHVGTVGAPVKLCSGSVRLSQPFTAGEAVGSMQPESDSPSPVDLTTKTKSHHSFLHSVKSPSSSPSFNCAGSFRNGFLSRLQSLCGTSRTDDSIEKNPLYEPERRTPWSAVYPDA
ncbi:Desumoylating isopeptidase 2 [Clonorchis sinensis]|uniref:Desumoylating isopeptidase 2 n=1 Tax=Clonorchis sinensis TaxID=79923 RepID=A0A419PNM1_CLOSI|nr:Desumoylating isopeptidase 2 [Clonorchis sinensis]